MNRTAVVFPVLSIILLVCLVCVFGRSAKADLPIRGFTDFGYLYENNNANNSFQIHDLDLFLSGPVDKKVSYLAEVNFQPSFTGIGVDLERTFVQYTVNPWFKVAAGRFHTALGYWNETFHHGSYLHTAATRPVMERFEDVGGLLPVHSTGIEVRGNGPMHGGNLGYIFNVGNGRGPVKDPPAFFHSYNRSKSVSGVVYFETDSGIRFGLSAYRSDLPGGSGKGEDSTDQATCIPGPGSANPQGGVANCGPQGVEYIGGVHFVYNSPTIEWLNEYAFMYHRYIHGYSNFDGTTHTNIHLLYSQLGYHVGLFTPYVRFEINASTSADAYLNANPGSVAQGLPATTRYYVAGTRYELSSGSALKAEFTYISSGAPIFQSGMPNRNPPDRRSDWTGNLNWSLAW